MFARQLRKGMMLADNSFISEVKIFPDDIAHSQKDADPLRMKRSNQKTRTDYARIEQNEVDTCYDSVPGSVVITTSLGKTRRFRADDEVEARKAA